jgi:hypothetical protein
MTKPKPKNCARCDAVTTLRCELCRKGACEHHSSLVEIREDGRRKMVRACMECKKNNPQVIQSLQR